SPPRCSSRCEDGAVVYGIFAPAGASRHGPFTGRGRRLETCSGELHERRDHHRNHGGLLRAELGTRRLLRPPGEEPPVSLLYWIAGLIALALAIYLFVALFEPEKF